MKVQGVKVPVSERSRDILLQGANVQGSELAWERKGCESRLLDSIMLISTLITAVICIVYEEVS